MFVGSVLIAYGAAMEFRYFGPGTPQFLAGLVATPAGLLGAAAAVALWRSGEPSWFVVATATALLAATLIATALDVMGPLATLLGLIGSIPPLVLGVRRRNPSS